MLGEMSFMVDAPTFITSACLVVLLHACVILEVGMIFFGWPMIYVKDSLAHSVCLSQSLSFLLSLSLSVTLNPSQPLSQ